MCEAGLLVLFFHYSGNFKLDYTLQSPRRLLKVLVSRRIPRDPDSTHLERTLDVRLFGVQYQAWDTGLMY